MSHNQIIREYKLTDFELAQTASDMLIAALRDTTQLEDMGFAPAKRAIIQTKINDLNAINPDTYYMNNVVSKRIMRDEKQKLVYEAATNIRKRMLIAWDGDDAKLVLAGKAFSQLDAIELYHAVETLADVAHDNLADFTDVHITQGLIDIMLTENGLLNTSVTNYNKEKSIRSEAAVTRIKAGNALYKDLSFLAQVGKSVWENIDPAKYDDYVINPTSGSSTQHVEGDAAPSQKITPAVNITDADVHIIAENQSTDSNIQVYFTHLVDGIPGPPALPPTPIPFGASINHLAGEFGWDTQNTVMVIEGLGPNVVPWKITVLG